mgnify:CR=1 FL=1
MPAKLFCLFSFLSMAFLLVIQAFNLRDTSEPLTIIMMLALLVSSLCVAGALALHKWSS